MRVLLGGLLATGVAVTFSAACGGAGGPSSFGDVDGGSGSNSGGATGGSSGAGGASGGACLTCGDAQRGAGSSGGPTTVCPAGLSCDVPCTGGGTTSISGKVYDPARKNPLYNVEVYVPQYPLEPLPKGVPTGPASCSCSALFKSGAVAATATGVDGAFHLANVPVSATGGSIPLVVQIGKWRKVFHVTPSRCADAPQPDKSLFLPGTLAGGDPNDNMPDIAVSTGSADTLECLMKRIGLPDSEYVAGAAAGGHVHIFAGGSNGAGVGTGVSMCMGNTPPLPETPGMAGAPTSWTSLWDTQADLMPYDITLLSCEGGETYSANPAALEAYLNAGGRVFASHYHYAWFTGPLDTVGANTYSAPADWGNNLATWTEGSCEGNSNGIIVQTLNGTTNPFVKGQKFYQWLGLNGALGVGGAPPNELPIQQARFNAVVGASNKPSQPWIQDDNSTPSNTMYFSFDTPIGASTGPDGTIPYCGRAVFSDLHVGAASNDSPNPPAGCASGDLSPQEMALEFMLFDLSSCVLSDATPPPDGGVILQ
jgi:hypothetical protein